MRITNSMQFDAMNLSMSKLETRLMNASKEASTGLKLQAPEDDPAGAAALVRLGTTEDQTTSFKSTIDRVQGDAALSEGTLASAGDLLSQARSLAIQGSSGALSASDRAILSKQVDGIFQDLLSLANTKGEHGYLFAGSATHTAPFDATGTFQANDDARQVQIADGVSVTANTSGARAFTAAGGTDVFQAVSALKTALAANDPAAVESSVNALDASSSQITAARSETGLLMARLDSTSSLHDQNLTLIASAKNGIANADLPAAYSALSQAQTTYTQAISVGKQVLTTLGAWYAA
jgi:flagellar hook-associated protein 3 FlgL